MIGAQIGFGVYVDTERAYAIQLSNRFGRVGLMGYGETEIKPAGGEPEAYSKAVGEAVRLAAGKAGFSGKTVAAALPGKDVVIRYFEMPLIPKNEWAAAIRYEAQKYMTLNPEDVYFNFEVETNKRDKRMRVVFLASPKETMQRMMSAYLDAGLSLRTLEPVSMSLMRAFLHHHPLKDSGAHAIIDVRNDGTINILIVRGRLLLMARDSVILKPGPGEGQPPSPDFGALITEMNLSLNYFFKNFKKEEIHNVFLLTDTDPLFKSWPERLGAELGLPIETPALSQLFGESDVYAPGRTVAMGLALREAAAFPARGSNLMPSDVAKTTRRAVETATAEQHAQQTRVAGRAQMQKGALIAGLGAFGLQLLTVGAVMAVNSSDAKKLKGMRALYASTEHVADPAAPIADIQAIEKRLADRSRYLVSLMGQRVYVTEKLSELARVMPKSVQLTTLDYLDTESPVGGAPQIILRLAGKALPRGVNPLDELNRLVASLKTSQSFMAGLQEVRISSLRRTPEETSFNIECLSVRQ